LRLIFILLLCVMSGIASAQASPPPLTIEEAVEQATQKNLRLSAAVRDVAAARFGVRAAHALTNPQALFTPGITSRSGTDEEFLIQQPLEINGTRSARSGVAEAHLRQTQAQTLVELRTVVFSTKTAYYTLARAREQLALTRDLLTGTEEVARFTKRQVELGARPGIDQTQIDIEAARARQQAMVAEGESTAAQAALNTLLGRASDTPIGPLSPLTYTTSPTDRKMAMQQATSGRAEIAAEQAAGDVFRHEARLAHAQGLPDLAPQFRAGSVIRRFDDYGIGLAITLPFDYGSRRDRIRQAEASALAQTDRVAATRNEVQQEVEQALARLHAAQGALREYDQGLLENSRRLLEASRTGFQVGQTSVLGLLEAQRTFRTVQSERINALVNYELACAELERATGAVPSTLLPTLIGLRRPK
jgi:cobalt-zinc-cadmium efflux system outer membrane protein